MPRARKAARLWLRPEERDGAAVRPARWIILDRGKQYATQCGADEGEGAERALAEHIASKHRPAGKRERHPSEVDIADVISVYIDAQPPFPTAAAQERFAGRCERLLEFGGGRPLSDVDAAFCQAYAKRRAGADSKTRKGGRRGGSGGARRDLEDLRAAVALHAKKRLHIGHVDVWLPPRGKARTRWLTRDEAAALLWACWRARERQKAKHDGRLDDAKKETKKHTLRHVARFVLLGLYTGTRAAAIANASYKASSGRSYVDLELGVFFRLAEGRTETKKRQPPAPLAPRLVAHMRRWRRLAEADEGRATEGYVVEYRGRPVMSVKVGFARAVELAGLGPDVTPHTLRHTAATWLVQNGVQQFDAAGFLGCSVQTLDRVYAHQDQRHLRHVAVAIARKPGNDTATIAVNRRGPKKNRAG